MTRGLPVTNRTQINMAQRFSKLHAALKATGYTATTGDAGEYFNYLKGVNKLKVARNPGGALLNRINGGVLPFGLTLAQGQANGVDGLQAIWTTQAAAIQVVTNALAPLTDYGLKTALTNTSVNPNFYAAKAIVTLRPKATATKSPKTSQITKRAYKAFNTRSGGIPFGRVAGIMVGNPPTASTLADCTEETVAKSLVSKLKEKEAGTWVVVGVNATPEDFKSQSTSGQNIPTPLPSLAL